MKYTEIFKLNDMLNEAKIPHELKAIYDNYGYQLVYPHFDKPILYVMETNYSNKDSLEIYGSLKQSLSPDDFTAEKVFGRIKKHYLFLKNREKQKLVELLNNFDKEIFCCDVCEHAGEGCDVCENEQLADYLVESGVTFNGTC